MVPVQSPAMTPEETAALAEGGFMLDATTIVAWLSLAITGFHLWYTLVRRGSVRMTQPSFILLGVGREGHAKVAIGAHLYTTGERPAIVEGMFVRVTRGGIVRDFDVWVHGAGSQGLVRGSGVHVGTEGVTADHHFLLQNGLDPFDFLAGQYTVKVFGTVVGSKSEQCFFTVTLLLTESMRDVSSGMFFDWRPSQRQYEAHNESRRMPQMTPDV